jgi:N-acetylmuramoyl-L-alanine amidase
MEICIDPGHGGADPGAIGLQPVRLQEKDFTLSQALLLKEELERLGHTVIMTRHQDRTLSLGARAAFANQFNADRFISIHANAAGTTTAEGMEVFHFPDSASGRPLAQSLFSEMMAAFPGHRNRGVKEANFAALRLTAMPAVLVECEFITNPTQLSFLRDPANQRTMAQALARGV